jgi:NAD dependent epimerase/dehydratase family enzyme
MWKQVVESLGVRRVSLRTGVVLNKDDGALKEMRFLLSLAGLLGSGKQWFPCAY